ncbi:MAG TPA: dTMP kinase [Gemmatimonadaceae bacterium]|nr:dTMP kinase [Gemmatimonadaceae bacterium]
MSRGKLIVFEGAEGAGKTTQIKRLAERLTESGIPCVAVREPGGTPVGDAIREILLDREWHITDAAEALLFMASRAELIAREIQPSLAEGRVVLMDRFFLSTYAYQIVGRGLPEAEVRAANRLATGGLKPDLTLLLDIPAAEGLARADARGGRDRVEKAGADFHDDVGNAFRAFTKKEWQASHPECGPITLIDGAGEESAVFARVAGALANAFPETFARVLG